jgi:hypothetical protein
MKKIYTAGIISAIFIMSAFLAFNMYSSTSFPGFSSSSPCNVCHNDPTHVNDVTGEIKISISEDSMWSTNGQFATNYVPIISVYNRSEGIDGVEFVKIRFLKNSTHIVVQARISDATVDANDKFAIIWNINVENFTIGEFLTSYSEGATSGNMAFSNGHADMWFWKESVVNANATGKALDYYIDTSHYNNDGTGKQDVTVTPYYVGGRYYIYFVRALTTTDVNDVQFEDGMAIPYALGHWDNSNYIVDHFSSFDKMVIVGDVIGVTQYIPTTIFEPTTVQGEPSGTTSSFTLITLVAGLIIAIPVMSFVRKRK